MQVSASGWILSKNVVVEEIAVVTVKNIIGMGYDTVERTGAPLSAILAKKEPRPNAVDACSVSKMRAFAAT